MYERIIEKIPVEKGWSGDKKYRAVLNDGTPLLLRITAADKFTRIETLAAYQKRAAALGVPMCETLETGICAEGAYALQTWIDGVDAEEAMPTLPASEQYALGIRTGRYLARMHTLPAPPEQPDWEERFNAKIDRKIRMHEDCPIKFPGAEHMLRYISENRHLLAGRPQSFQHGDYHIGNMMLRMQNGVREPVIIDFDRYDFGDPWEEFNRIVWCAQAAPAFAAGMVDGYFGGEVPEKFWRLLALYISSNTLSSVPWAIPFGEGEIAVMRKQAAEVLGWYDNMREVVPSWYREHGIAVRRFREADAEAVSALIARTLRESNSRDYPPEYIENDVKAFTPDGVIQRAGWTHFYIVCAGDTIIGCGAIGPYWDKTDESSLFNIFVLPEWQGCGIGRRIIAALEADEYFLRAKRVEIPASITACAFYRKLGYDYKNGIAAVDDELLYRLEKFR